MKVGVWWIESRVVVKLPLSTDFTVFFLFIPHRDCSLSTWWVSDHWTGDFRSIVIMYWSRSKKKKNREDGGRGKWPHYVVPYGIIIHFLKNNKIIEIIIIEMIMHEGFVVPFPESFHAYYTDSSNVIISMCCLQRYCVFCWGTCGNDLQLLQAYRWSLCRWEPLTYQGDLQHIPSSAHDRVWSQTWHEHLQKFMSV